MKDKKMKVIYKTCSEKGGKISYETRKKNLDTK